VLRDRRLRRVWNAAKGRDDMKRILLVLIPTLLLSGCASLWKTMGVATIAQEAEREKAAAAEMAEVKRLIQELQTKAAEIERLTAAVDEASARAQRVDELAKTVDELAAALQSAGLEDLRTQVDELRERAKTLPDETLRRLVEILDAALAGK